MRTVCGMTPRCIAADSEIMSGLIYRRRVLVKKRLAGAVMAATLVVGLIPAAAQAGKPLDVDCELLAATYDAVNDFLDGEGVQFDNVGDLISSSIQDEELFDQLSALILFFSGGEIEFTSGTQAVATSAKCGLAPQVIDNIGD